MSSCRLSGRVRKRGSLFQMQPVWREKKASDEIRLMCPKGSCMQQVRYVVHIDDWKITRGKAIFRHAVRVNHARKFGNPSGRLLCIIKLNYYLVSAYGAYPSRIVYPFFYLLEGAIIEFHALFYGSKSQEVTYILSLNALNSTNMLWTF